MRGVRLGLHATSRTSQRGRDRRYYVSTAAAADRRKALLPELARLETELQRYAEAIGAGDPLPAILVAMRTRERGPHELNAQLAAVAVDTAPSATLAAIYRELSSRLTDWQGLLARHPERSRDILRKLLVGRLILTPRELDGARVFQFRGNATSGALLGHRRRCERYGAPGDSLAFVTRPFSGIVRAA